MASLSCHALFSPGRTPPVLASPAASTTAGQGLAGRHADGRRTAGLRRRPPGRPERRVERRVQRRAASAERGERFPHGVHVQVHVEVEVEVQDRFAAHHRAVHHRHRGPGEGHRRVRHRAGRRRQGRPGGASAPLRREGRDRPRRLTGPGGRRDRGHPRRPPGLDPQPGLRVPAGERGPAARPHGEHRDAGDGGRPVLGGHPPGHRGRVQLRGPRRGRGEPQALGRGLAHVRRPDPRLPGADHQP
ncbi:exported hypothetical protein [Streptomyces misionensis JCM 4497]